MTDNESKPPVEAVAPESRAMTALATGVVSPNGAPMVVTEFSAPSKPRRKPGRPKGSTKLLDPEVEEKLLNGIRLGLPPERACYLANIAERTLDNWIRLGTDGEVPGVEPYKSFVERLRKADVQGEAHVVMLIQKSANEGDGASQRWLAERRWRDRWGAKSAVEVSGPGGKPQQFEHAGPGGVPLGVVVLPPIEEPAEHPEGVVAGAQVRVAAPAPSSADVEVHAVEPSSPAPPPRTMSAVAGVPVPPATLPPPEEKPEPRAPSFADMPVRPGRAESISDLIARSHAQDRDRGRGTSW